MKSSQLSKAYNSTYFDTANHVGKNSTTMPAVPVYQQKATHQQSFSSPLQLKDKPAGQRKNNTGLPDNLKTGVEGLSGFSMDDVKVHYNSAKPAQLNALAYAQGTNIHIGPGQEQHLPHEAWHVVQQKQNRVNPTTQFMGEVGMNDDTVLESEADMMGAKAMNFTGAAEAQPVGSSSITKFQLKSGAVDGRNTIQPIMDKLGMNKEQFKKASMSTVYLLAVFESETLGIIDLGIFQSEKRGHAEEIMISKINSLGLRDGVLRIELSTSPCSSHFGTREDGEKGCHERLSGLKSDLNIDVSVKADHLYQPTNIGMMECQNQARKGFSSVSAAFTADYDIEVTKLPSTYKDYTEIKGDDTGIIQR